MKLGIEILNCRKTDTFCNYWCISIYGTTFWLHFHVGHTRKSQADGQPYIRLRAFEIWSPFVYPGRNPIWELKKWCYPV